MHAVTYADHRKDAAYVRALSAPLASRRTYLVIVPNIKLNCREKKKKDSDVSNTHTEKRKTTNSV